MFSILTDGDAVHELIQKMFSEGVNGDIQYRVNHPKHGQRTMHSTGEPMFEDGEVARLIGNTLDITEQEECDAGAAAARSISGASSKAQSHRELRVGYFNRRIYLV